MQHRANNLEKIRQYDRERSKLAHRRQQLQELSIRTNKDPIRKRAHDMTSNAIRDGKLTRPSACSECLQECKPEAHHDDYTKPLDVRWLCRSCHCRHHRLESLSLRYTLASAL
jgi:hypothetical protein